MTHKPWETKVVEGILESFEKVTCFYTPLFGKKPPGTPVRPRYCKEYVLRVKTDDGYSSIPFFGEVPGDFLGKRVRVTEKTRPTITYPFTERVKIKQELENVETGEMLKTKVTYKL